MAPTFISRLTLFTLTLALCFAVLPAPVHAAAALDTTAQLKTHVIKFYLDPALVPDMSLAKSVLPKYVADMNAILAKNTSRRFVFDPETGIILTGTKPQTDSARPPLPTEGFEVWAYAIHSDRNNSYGGYAGMDKSGAGVLAGLHWTRLYDPENLAAGDVLDYSIQLNNMLHELAHIFGAGIGEYYNLAHINDTTATAPLLNINLDDPQDPFWAGKTDFAADPLLRLTYAATRADYLAAVKYSDLTAAVMSGDYRNGIPSFSQYTVQVLDGNGQPLEGANVKVWNVSGNAPYASQSLFDGLSDANGQVVLDWGGTGNVHNSDNFLRLIKVYKDGLPVAQPRYVSIYDADSALLVAGSATYTLNFQMAPTPSAQSATFTSAGAYDGWVLAASKTNKQGGSINNNATTFFLGDDKSNDQYRSILSFDTSSLPDNAIITGVTLKIRKQSQVGNDPFSTLGALQIDVRKGPFSNSAALQPADFQAAANANSAGQIRSAPKAGNWYVTNLDPAAYSFINLGGATQLRLHFVRTSDSDKQADYLKFFSGNAPAGEQPALVIEYSLP